MDSFILLQQEEARRNDDNNAKKKNDEQQTATRAKKELPQKCNDVFTTAVNSQKNNLCIIDAQRQGTGCTDRTIVFFS